MIKRIMEAYTRPLKKTASPEKVPDSQLQFLLTDIISVVKIKKIE